MDANLGIKLTAKDDGSVVIEQFAKRLKSVSVSAKEMNATLGGISTTLKGLVGSLGVGLGAAELVSFFRSSVQEAQEAERATLKLNATLRATGNAAGLTAGDIRKYADELQVLTGVENDLWTDAAAVMATFRNVQGQTFKDSLALAGDLSAVMGQDLKGSIVQVGKALNDPIQGLTALRRVGVSFTEAQQEQIKSLVKSGDLYKAQQIVLQELREEFGGASAEMEGPLSKAISTVDLAWKDLKENIGNSDVIVSSLHRVAAAMGTVEKAAEDWETIGGAGSKLWNFLKMGYFAAEGMIPGKDWAAERSRQLAAELNASIDAARVPMGSAHERIPFAPAHGQKTRATGAPGGSGVGGAPATERNRFWSWLGEGQSAGLTSDKFGKAEWEAVASLGAFRERLSRDFWDELAPQAHGAKALFGDLSALRQTLGAQGGYATAQDERARGSAWAGLQPYRLHQASEDEAFLERMRAVDEEGSAAFGEWIGNLKEIENLLNALPLDESWLDDWRSGVVEAAYLYEENFTDALENVAEATGSALRQMEDFFVDFATTGKLEFRGLVQSIVADLARLTVRQQITGPLAAGLASLFSGGGGAATYDVGGITMGAGNTIPVGWGGGLASGGVVSRPTLALIGEAGPEAVVPLHRAAVGGVNVTIHQTVSGLGDDDLVRNVRGAAYQAGLAGARAAVQGAASDPAMRRAVRQAAFS